jgi:hypothetical protein
MHELVMWLLTNADDKSSADLEVRKIWNERRNELRQRDRKVHKRLDDCLSKRGEEVSETPGAFVSFVVYGIEGKAIESPGMVLSDGTIVDEIYRNGQAHFLVWKDGDHKIVDLLEVNGVTFVPIDDDLLRKSKILLPSSIEEYGTEERLLQEIISFGTKYVEVDPTNLKLASLQKMTEWLLEKLPVLPIINPRGGADTGKTRLANVLWQVSFRGMRADGVLSLSSLFRNAEKWRGTLYINEADIDEKTRSEDSESSQQVKFYNSRYERDAAVWRTNKETLKPEVFDSFGPTILVTRKGFRDDALESRCFVVPMYGRTRTDIRLNLPSEFNEQGLHLRNKLELFRLKNLQRFSNDFDLEFNGVSTRMNQILQPMASLAKVHLPSLYPQIESLARQLSEKVVEQRALSDDGMIVRAYLALDPQLNGISASSIAEYIRNEFGPELKAERIGRRARSLGFVSFRALGAMRYRLLKLESDHAIRMLNKYVSAEERDELRPIHGEIPQKKLIGFGDSENGVSTSYPSSTVPTVPTSTSKEDGSDSKGRLLSTLKGDES